MSQAGRNLRHLRKLKGWTQDEFAAQLNVKRSLIGAYEEERADPRIDILEKAMEIFELSMDDLLLKDVTVHNTSYLAKRRQLKMAVEKSNITFVPVKAAAGYLAGYNDHEFIDELNTFHLPMLMPGEYRAFEIVGDSMLPTPSGSIIVGEKIETIEAVKSDQTYIVVSTTDGIVYKRIKQTPQIKTTLTLESDNPSYPPYTVQARDIAEIWLAKLVVSKPVEKPVWDINNLAEAVTSLQAKLDAFQKP